MTQLLTRAFAAAAELPDAEQDAVAAIVLAELQSEQRWAQAFTGSQDQLAALAEEGLRELAAGHTQPMDLQRDFPHD